MSELTLTAGGGKSTTEYQKAPLGEHSAVLVDIILSENEMTNYGIKDQYYFYFEIEAKMDDGRPFLVRKKFSAPKKDSAGVRYSMSEKSNLYKFLVKWRGKPFEPGEDVALADLISTGCTLEIAPWTPEGGEEPIHLVDRARKLPKKDWIKPSGEYDGDRTRERIEKYREENNSDTPAAATQPATQDGAARPFEENDDVPF